MKILIVEDDSFYAEYISELLRDRGIESTHVSSAQDAIAIDLQGYAAAIIDVMLPNDPALSGITVGESRGGYCAGVAVARRLLDREPKLPLILLSSAVAGSEGESWAASKGIPFIQKSEKSATLIDALA